MQTHINTSVSTPDILVGHADHYALIALADQMNGPLAKAADALVGELERATVVPQQDLPDGIVRLGSKVAFETDSGGTRTFKLVLPGEASVDDGRISVLTPIGTALIGLKEGQSIAWYSRDGRENLLFVRKVTQERM